MKISSFYFFISIFYLPILKGQCVELQTETGVPIAGIDAGSNTLLQNSTYLSATARFAWQADTHKIYSKIYNYHLVGLGIYAATFNNRSIGDPLAFYFYIKNPIICKGHWNFFYEIGAGVAGNFNAYDKNLNPENKMIGSNINMTGHLSAGIEYHISKRFGIGLSAGYRHFSNGFIKWPNNGINILPMTLTGVFNYSKSITCPLKKGIPTFLKHNQFIVFYAPGSKNFNPEENNYFSSTLSLLFLRQINYKAALGGGFDLFYNSSGIAKVDSKEDGIIKTLSCGPYLSFEWVLTEKFRINTGAGIYLLRHAQNAEPTFFYERISARCMLTKRLFAGVGIKINGDTSDYIEWTLGYAFKNDKNIYK